MVIGVLKEIKGNEYRVAAVPATVHEIVRHGHTVYVETGAGVGSGFSDAQMRPLTRFLISPTLTPFGRRPTCTKVKELPSGVRADDSKDLHLHLLQRSP